MTHSKLFRSSFLCNGERDTRMPNLVIAVRILYYNSEKNPATLYCEKYTYFVSRKCLGQPKSDFGPQKWSKMARSYSQENRWRKVDPAVNLNKLAAHNLKYKISVCYWFL